MENFIDSVKDFAMYILPVWFAISLFIGIKLGTGINKMNKVNHNEDISEVEDNFQFKRKTG